MSCSPSPTFSDNVKSIILHGLFKDARNCMHFLMSFSVILLLLGSYMLRDELRETDTQNVYDGDFYSRLFYRAIEFTLIVSLPTIIDMTLSVVHLQTWEELQLPIEFSRRYIFTVIFIPNCLIYWEVMPAVLIDLTMFFQYLLVFYTLIYRIHTLSINQQKGAIQAFPLRGLFISCIGCMLSGFFYKLANYQLVHGKKAWKLMYTLFLLLLQALTCLKLKPWFNITLQFSKVLTNHALSQNRVPFYSLMVGILTCTTLTVTDAITFNQSYIYFPVSGDSLAIIEWLFCIMLVTWTSVRNFDNLKDQILTRNQLAYNRKMTRSISHEIRTPLNTAFMAIDLLIASLNQQQIQNSKSISQSFDSMDQIYNLHQLQDRESETKNLLEIAENIKGGCDIALNILNQLLTFEKLSAGMMQLENKTITLYKLLDSNMKLFKMQAQQCGITFKLDPANVNLDELKVHVDEHKMNQVVRNLLSNAMKFTPRGGVVEVKLQWVPSHERNEVIESLTRPLSKEEDEDSKSNSFYFSPSRSRSSRSRNKQTFHGTMHHFGEYIPDTTKSKSNFTPVNLQSNVPVYHSIGGLAQHGTILIAIIDSGPGVSKSDQKRLFQEYVQINPGELQKGQGTGLGLSISKSIVHLHGGNVGMTSEGKGKGSTFYIELPSYVTTAKDDVLAGLYDSVLDHGRIFGGGSTGHHATGGGHGGSNTSTIKNVPKKTPFSGFSIFGQKQQPKDIRESNQVQKEMRKVNQKKSKEVNVPNEIQHQATRSCSNGESADANEVTSCEVYGPDDKLENFDIEQGTVGNRHMSHKSEHPSDSPPKKMENTNGFLSSFKNFSSFHSQVVPDGGNNEVHHVQDISDNRNDDHLDRDESEQNGDDMDVIDYPPDATGKVKQNIIPVISNNAASEEQRGSSANGMVRQRSSRRSRLSFSSPTQSYNILIADDSAPNRKMLQRLLTREHHNVTEASDGDDAVECVYLAMQAKSEKPRYDLILMDFYMNHMNGPEAIKAIRQMGYQGMIVGVTGVMDDDVDLFLDAGANIVLCKPVSLAALWKALRGTNFFDNESIR